MPMYRLRQNISGVEHSPIGMNIVQIPAGEVLALPASDKESGLIDILFHGRNVMVFAQDLRERSRPLDSGVSVIDDTEDSESAFDPTA